jgi:hypothetical protein
MFNPEEIYRKVKGDLCGLVDFKLRGGTLEIITPVGTLTNRFVSVFVSQTGETYIVSDGGWLDRHYYENHARAEDEEINDRIEDQLRGHFGVKTTTHRDGTVYNFKSTDDIELISLLVHELSSFVGQMTNSQSMAYLEEKVPQERTAFVNEVNSFLKVQYPGVASFNDSLASYNPELSNIKFSAIIRRASKTHLVMYVNGYNSRMFVRSASEAVVNFRIAKSYTKDAAFSRTAIINTHAGGFNPYRVKDYLTELQAETTGGKLIDFYQNKEDILVLIPGKAS